MSDPQPERIDRYRLLQELGEGGFGVVYLAEQDQPVRRQVALKVVKLGMDTRDVVARFEAERQALAMMDHPNIAKVLDGGATASGRPYFVMELVRGLAITEFCDRENLSIAARLELFVTVCEAVQHAHQKGVIHRDLKPSNVLVAVADGRPVPKVIDFGIAKALHTRLTEKTLFTQLHHFIGTPEDMSPEQADASALDVDTRSDIYALGVLLYELLTGTTPFDARALLEAGLSEIQRTIREVPPERPSSRVTTGQHAADVARRRDVDQANLARRLRGDLDWIVLKALAKERDRRYATASALGADVHRHLASEPVEAGPPSAWYRIQKLARRNRGTVSAVGLAVLGVVAAVFVISSALVEARREADHGRALTEFLVETLAMSDSEVVMAPEVSVQSLLDRAASRVKVTFVDRPAVEARVRATIGRAYESLGSAAKAEKQLRRAIALHDQHGGIGSVELYEALWATTHTAFTLNRPDAFVYATRSREVAHGIIRESYPELADVVDRFDLLVREAAYANDESKFEASRDLFETARRRADAMLEDDDPLWPLVADTFLAAGYTLWYSPFEGRAIDYYEQALELQKRVLPPTHPRVAETLTVLVGIYNRAGRLDEAERTARVALSALQAVYGDQHPQVGYAKQLLGETLTALRQFDEAARMLEEGVGPILANAADPRAFYVVEAYRRLVALYDAKGDPAAAAPWREKLAETVAISHVGLEWVMARDAFGPDHKELVAITDRLNEAFGGPNFSVTAGSVEVGDVGSDIDALGALVLRFDAAAPSAAIIGHLMLGWANSLRPGSQDALVHRLVAEAERVLRPWGDRNPIALADAIARNAAIDVAAGNAEAARVRALEALGLAAREAFENDSWIEVNVRVRIAQALVACGLHAEARESLEHGVELLALQLGSKHADTEIARGLLEEVRRATTRAR